MSQIITLTGITFGTTHDSSTTYKIVPPSGTVTPQLGITKTQLQDGIVLTFSDDTIKEANVEVQNGLCAGSTALMTWATPITPTPTPTGPTPTPTSTPLPTPTPPSSYVEVLATGTVFSSAGGYTYISRLTKQELIDLQCTDCTPGNHVGSTYYVGRFPMQVGDAIYSSPGVLSTRYNGVLVTSTTGAPASLCNVNDPNPQWKIPYIFEIENGIVQSVTYQGTDCPTPTPTPTPAPTPSDLPRINLQYSLNGGISNGGLSIGPTITYGEIQTWLCNNDITSAYGTLANGVLSGATTPQNGDILYDVVNDRININRKYIYVDPNSGYSISSAPVEELIQLTTDGNGVITLTPFEVCGAT
jgi:hypothetical protein